MEYRRLGRIALGFALIGSSGRTVSTRWWGACSNAEAVSLLREARSFGVAFLAASHRYREGQAGAAGIVRWCAAPRTACTAATFAAISAQGGR
jgi:aryl-alcohol dehydrogenase-like predicted oxidoreductase